MSRLLAVVVALLVLACSKEPQGTPTNAPSAPTTTPNATAPAIAPGTQPAELGKPAPDFALKDLDGKPVSLSSFKGKVVVLEWFNPGCPFVKKSHTLGSLVSAAKKHTEHGVVWLAINSGAAGRQGAGVDTNREAQKTFNMAHPILLDESGEVGKIYGATNTPHMFVIDEQGTLVYRGAPDNSPDGEGQSAPDGKLVSFIDTTLAAVAAKKAPEVSETKPYGCSVKYAK